MCVRHLAPGSGGGAGTGADPFGGLSAAQAAAEPGDLFLVHAGVHEGPFTLDGRGEAGRPTIWHGEGEAVTDGQGQAAGPGSVRTRR